jgi:hypothetical protein
MFNGEVSGRTTLVEVAGSGLTPRAAVSLAPFGAASAASVTSVWLRGSSYVAL